MTEEVIVNADGSVEFIYSDTLASLFADEAATTRRASHVEPANGGGWLADMSPVDGPVLTDHGVPFSTRAAALVAEKDWLLARMREGRI